ncbi:aldehyde dehydrogenase [Aeromicrobium sp. CTD01-1L150]|uniref:aldehyde dehydrogenase n=1 Tax=Aeromicrobium sp. CTD01-1L150 TaxID=3341830 RepID=UPI0035BFDA63
MVIGGEHWDAADGRTLESIDPFTARSWATVPRAGAKDVELAVDAARSALGGEWGTMSATARGEALHRLADLIAEHAEELAVMETRDNGKVIRETRGQVAGLPSIYRFFAGAADKIEGSTFSPPQTNFLTYSQKRPIGVVAAILPWNSPLYLLANKLAPALAAGCTFVAKPSEYTSVSTLRFAELALEAGLPPGVLNVVTGDGEAGAALAEHPGVDKVTFTGSTATGQKIMKAAAENIAPVTLELGGKSPNIVFDDADLGAAVNGIVAGIFAATGQTCIAGSRVLVHEDVADRVIAEVSQRASAIRMGDPLDMETEMGPIAFDQQLQKVASYVDGAVRDGAAVAYGGGRPAADELATGYFHEPTVLTGVHNQMAVAREEIFGPVASFITFGSEDEAVQLANDTPFGLAAGIWSTNIQRAHRVAGQLSAGTIWVNAYRTLAYNVPYGGMKQSGIGREYGLEGLEEYLETASIWVELSGQTRDPFQLG